MKRKDDNLVVSNTAYYPDTRLRTYLMAFSSDVLARMSGPISVPFVVLAFWVSSHVQKTLYACVAVLCVTFASYRVWQKERKDASVRLNERYEEVVALTQRVNSLTESLTAVQQRPRLKLLVTVQEEDYPQVMTAVADRSITVLRVEYMMTTEAVIAAEDVFLQGESIKIPINNDLLAKLWNAKRPDRSTWDGSGPAMLGITVATNGQSYQLIMPIMMEFVMRGNMASTTVVGSKTFQI